MSSQVEQEQQGPSLAEAGSSLAEVQQQGLATIEAGEEGTQAMAAMEEGLDTAELAARVRHYLKFNQIQSARFGSLVLGVSQGRLSTLLGHPRPWDQLGPRVRALYARLHLWMDTRATYGNNPHAKQRLGKAAGSKVSRGKVGKKERKPRSLIEMPEEVVKQEVKEEMGQEIDREMEQDEEEQQYIVEVVEEGWSMENAEVTVVDEFEMEQEAADI